MFFIADNKINVIQFGTGDIEIAAGLLDEIDRTIGCISLCPRKPSDAGTLSTRDECELDTMFGVHTRLTFTEIRSINILIEQLNEVKRCMIRDQKG